MGRGIDKEWTSVGCCFLFGVELRLVSKAGEAAQGPFLPSRTSGLQAPNMTQRHLIRHETTISRPSRYS